MNYMKNDCLEYLKISKMSTVIDSMRKIDKNSKGILMVEDEHNRVVGTITDGDIRRAILKGESVMSTIGNLYNCNYIYVNSSTNENDIKKIFIDKKIKFIPVIDDTKKFIGYYEIDDFIDYCSIEKDNPVLIMAGGMGSRLKPLTNDLPKPMLKVGEKPILQTIIEQFKEYGFKNIYLSVNYKADIIENYFRDGRDFGVSIKYIKETKRLGTAGSIKLAEHYIDKQVIVINGDILTNINLYNILQYHMENNFSMTIGSRSYEMQVPYGVLKVENSKIISLKEKPVYNYVVSGGVYVINPEIIKYIPENEYYDITDLISKLIQEDKKLGSFPIKDYWMDIGKIEDYYKANDDINKYF